MKRLTDTQLAFIVVAAFNIVGGIWVMYRRGDENGLICVFVGCMLLITARNP